jgi:hypothetical protein
MKPWEFIQSARVSESPPQFDKKAVLHYLKALPEDQFNEFCQGYLHYGLFYGSHVCSFATSDKAFLKNYPDRFWQMMPFDPKTPYGSVKKGCHAKGRSAHAGRKNKRAG